MATTSRPSSSLDADSFGDWFRVNGRVAAIVGGAAVLALAGAYLWRWNAAGTATRAETAYYRALQTPAQPGNTGQLESALRQVATGYDGTAGGAQAQMQLAQLLFDQGKYQDGLTVLDGASDAPEQLRDGIASLRAAGYEGLGRFADAAKLYESLVASAPSPDRQHALRASAARSYQAGNDRASALRIWQEIAARESSALAAEARVRVGELSAAPAR